MELGAIRRGQVRTQSTKQSDERAASLFIHAHVASSPGLYVDALLRLSYQSRLSHTRAFRASSPSLLLAPAASGTLVKHQHHKQYNSKYFSLHETTPLPHMDIGKKGAIEEALRHRSFDNEIIITCFTESAIRWMVRERRSLEASS